MTELDPAGLADLPAVEAVLWDFGDTLADERWMLAPMAGQPAWPDLYLARCGEGELGSLWNRGLKTAREVAAALGAELGVDGALVFEHMQACSRQVRLYPRVAAFVDALAIPQAIVTVNCDIFSDVVVPALDLASRFSPVVASWEAGIEDKADLCDLAMAKLGLSDRADCLLIDNRADNVASWRARGGSAYRFVGEQALVEQLSPTLQPILRAP